jgi:hypothetical protein
MSLFSKDKEGFWGNPGRAWKVDREQQIGNSMYSIPGTYQSVLSPRFSNVDYGANLSTEMRNVNPALPRGNQGCSVSGRLSEHYSPGFADGDFNQVARNLGGMMNDNVSMVKLQGEDGGSQPIIYDRYMAANKQSRLRRHGDQIRGDLPIAPITRGMFDVKPSPNLDLQSGALNVMAGSENESGRALTAMIRQASGYGETTIGGINLENTPGVPSYEMGLAGAHGDIQVRGFP